MRTVTFNPNNTSLALRNIAKERGNLRVEFTHGNEVQFERLGNGHRVRWIRCDGSTTYLHYLSSSTEDLSEEENGLLCAAMMKLKITSVMVGNNDIVILGAPMVNVIIEQPIIIDAEPEPVRHASNWDRAREFGVSGHRTKQQSKPVEPVRLPTTKGGWLAFGVITAIAVVATAVAAAHADQ